MKDHLLTLFAYDKWANERITRALQAGSVSDEKILFWLSHIINAEYIWWDRMNARIPRLSVTEIHRLDVCEELLSSFYRELLPWLEALKSRELEVSFAYQNSQGSSFENTRKDVLTHVVNHGTHHRAQISARLRELGFTPPPTDYIFFLRE